MTQRMINGDVGGTGVSFGYSRNAVLTPDEIRHNARSATADFNRAEFQVTNFEANLKAADEAIQNAIRYRADVAAKLYVARQQLAQFRHEMVQALLREQALEPAPDPRSELRPSVAKVVPQLGGTLDAAVKATFAPTATAEANEQRYYLELSRWQMGGKVGPEPERPASMKPAPETPAEDSADRETK